MIIALMVNIYLLLAYQVYKKVSLINKLTFFYYSVVVGALSEITT